MVAKAWEVAVVEAALAVAAASLVEGVGEGEGGRFVEYIAAGIGACTVGGIQSLVEVVPEEVVGASRKQMVEAALAEAEEEVVAMVVLKVNNKIIHKVYQAYM